MEERRKRRGDGPGNEGTLRKHIECLLKHVNVLRVFRIIFNNKGKKQILKVKVSRN